MDNSFLQPEFVEKVYAQVLGLRGPNARVILPEVERTIKSVISALLKEEAEYITAAEEDVAPRKQQLFSRYAQEVLRREATVKRIDEEKEEAIRKLKRKLEAHDERWLRDGPALCEKADIYVPDEWDFHEYKWFGRVDPHRDLYEKAVAAEKAAIRTLRKAFDKRYLNDPLDNMEALEAHFTKLRQETWDKHEAQAKYLYNEAVNSDDVPRRADLLVAFFENNGTRSAIRDALPEFLCEYLSFIKPYLTEATGPKIALINVIEQHPASLLSLALSTFIRDPKETEIRFVRVGAVLQRNRTKLANEVTVEWLANDSPLKPAEMIDMCLRGTCLHSLFEVQVSMPDVTAPEIDETAWYSHCLLLAQSGFGKTNTIQWRIAQLLPKVAAGQASLVVMEPKSVLIDALMRLPEVHDKIVLLDPVDCPVSINLFDKGDGSEQAFTDSLAMLEYAISIFATGITELQRGPLTFVLRLMFAMDGEVSIETLDDVLRNGAKNHREALSRCGRVVQRFFELDWDTDSQVKANAAQLRARINTVLGDPKFERLLYTESSTFNMLDEIQAGKLILINADQDKLGEGHPTEMYGRFWIAQIFKAALRRFSMLRRGLPIIPTFFIIDEAQVFIAEDTRLRSILGQARQAKIGMMFAMHHMGDIEDQQIKDSIYTNTALKFVAHTSADIHNLARSMGRTTPEFLTTTPQHQFAFFGPNMQEAVRVKVPLVELDKEPRITEQQYQQLLASNRRRQPPTPPKGYAPPASPPQQVGPTTTQRAPDPPPPQGPQTTSKDTW